MPQPRKFDHDAARTLLQAGFTQGTVAAMLGVSQNAVSRIATPENTRKVSARAKLSYTAPCSKCGGPCVSAEHPSKRGMKQPRAICRSCHGKERRSRFRYDELGQVAAVLCFTCKTFKHPEAFGAGWKFKDVRPEGFHNSCRTCLTQLRQNYRERHKVPCERCGKPRLPAGEKGTRSKRDTGLCKACYVESITKVAASVARVTVAMLAHGSHGR